MNTDQESLTLEGEVSMARKNWPIEYGPIECGVMKSGVRTRWVRNHGIRGSRFTAWHVAVVLAAVLGALPAMAITGSSTQVTAWTLADRSCAVPAGTFSVACGNLGRFIFTTTGGVDCQPGETLDAGVVEEKAYPSPRLASVELADTTAVVLPTALLRTGAADPALAGLDAKVVRLPAAPLPPPPARTVVIDWNDGHGAAVLSIIAELAGGAAEPDLLALDDPGLIAGLGPDIGDPHVLANLCQVAEEVDFNLAPKPVAINMSFGRWSVDSLDPTICSGTLPCQIARVIRHLSNAGVVSLAAAGNHQALLFPARLSDVLSVGAMDLAYYNAHGIATPSWETPAGVDVLLPGDNVCAGGVQLGAGTSFAAAGASGYVSALTPGSPGLDPSAGQWAPAMVSESQCYVMSTGTSTLPGCQPTLDQFLVHALTATPPASPGSGGQSPAIPLESPSTPSAVRTVPVVRAPVAMPAGPSHAKWQSDTQNPLPGEEICLPCIGGYGGGGSSLRMLANVPGKAASLPVPGQDIVLDLRGAPALSSDLQVLDLYLRVGDLFYPLAADARTLADLKAGSIDFLVLQDALSVVLSDEQPSFFVREWTDIDGDQTPGVGEVFWNSSPIFEP